MRSRLKRLEPVLHKLEARGCFTGEDRAAFLALPFRFETLPVRGVIALEGERTPNCCALLSGFAHRNKVVGNGGRQILALHIPGDFVDLQNSLLGVADHTVQMIVPGDVAFVPAREVEALAFSRPAIGRAMWLETLIDGSINREWLASVGRRDARSRLAHLLCEFAIRLSASAEGEEPRYELPMTQEQLADAVGLTPVHVNRMLQRLRRDGLLARDQRSVTITDWRGLASVGDFDPGYLHPEHGGGRPR